MVNCVKPESVGMCSARLGRIKQVMQEHIDQEALVGVSTMVCRRGEIVHFEQVGLRDREAQKPMTPDTLFRLYSMTKPIVCTALMVLYEQGKFDLRDPVAKFIPAFENLKVLEKNNSGEEVLVDLKQPMTIRHLLTHTSGLVYDFYEESPVCELYRKNGILSNRSASLAEFVDELSKLPLGFQPGERWFYSVSIDVIARLIEIIANKSLMAFLREVIFEPLNMQDISFYVAEDKRDQVAAVYGAMDLCAPGKSWSDFVNVTDESMRQRLDVTASSPIDDPNFARGGHGLVSTISDYMCFAKMLLNKGRFDGGSILSPKIIEFMHMNHLDAALLPIGFEEWQLFGYGFGLGSRVLCDVAASELPGSVGEFGWGGAAKTYYWVDPEEELVGVFMAQSMMNFTSVERKFQTLVYQAML